MSDVLVSLDAGRVRALEYAREKLARLAVLGVDVGELVDVLGDIVDDARRERTHSVDYRKVAEDGLRRMSLPDVEGYPLGSAKATALREADRDVY